MDIRCDLKNDLNAFAQMMMKSKGYKYRKNHKISTFHQYMNILIREVSPLPREVFVSSKLKCPTELRIGFDAFIKKLKRGYNVNPYLSSDLRRADYNDGFLNDFGLHHFHLGTEICKAGKSKGFINRTGPILVAYVTNKSAYLIGIYEHGKNAYPYLWTDQYVIEVIHNEWPYVLSAFKINGLLPSPAPITPEQRQILRRNSYNSFIEMPDGTIYAPIGGGITGANTNSKLTIEFDRFYIEVKLILSELCSYINMSSDYRMVYPVKLTLSSIVGGYLFNDTSNNIQYFARRVGHCNLQITKIINGVLPEHYPHYRSFKVNIITELIIANKGP